MEIKANYILIGLFTVLGLLAGLGFFVWLAGVELDRQFRLYDIYFDSVSGLSPAAEVRFNGLPVGQVIDLDLAPERPSIRVRIEVAAETPIRTDTVAQLQSQGVTGVAFVSLAGGTAEEPLLREVSEDPIPTIASERSVIQALTEDAPNLVNEARDLLQQLQGFAGPDNQARVGQLLENLSQSSGELEQALTDFSNISQAVATGATQITEFTGRLDEIGSSVQSALATLETTLEIANRTIAEAETTMITATETLGAARQTFEIAGETIGAEVPRVAGDVSNTVTSVGQSVEAAMGEVTALAGRFGGAADLAETRLTELGETLAIIDSTLVDASESFEAVEIAAEDFDLLIEQDGAPLVVEARQTLDLVDSSLSTLNEILTTDTPLIVADIREAAAAAQRVVATVEQDLAALPERLGPLGDSAETALGAATQTLERTQTTLAAIDQAVATADRTLTAAEGAFSGADRIIGQEIAPAMADVRQAASQIEETMAQLTADLPDIAADLRETAARARAVADEIQQAVRTSTAPINDFARRGLPEFTQFARDAQGLVVALERLVARIERNPTRFFFGDATPEFRR